MMVLLQVGRTLTRGKHGHQFLDGYLAIVIRVYQVEHYVEVLLVQQGLLVNGRLYKLHVVDLAIVVEVHLLQ